MANPANGAASPLTVDGLTNNQTYFARVRARNAAGWGPWSDLSVPFTPKAAPDAGDGPAYLHGRFAVCRRDDQL
jgi:hypothetical protein